MTSEEVAGTFAELGSGNYFLDPLPAYQSQFASRTLVSEFLDGRIPAEQDPAWRDFGFASSGEYAFWSRRLCGIACMTMVLGSEKSMAGLAQEALRLGGYQVADESGSFVDRGWFYRPLLELAGQYGYQGAIQASMAHEDLCRAVLANRHVVVSVHPGVVRGDLDVAPGAYEVATSFSWWASGYRMASSPGSSCTTPRDAYRRRRSALSCRCTGSRKRSPGEGSGSPAAPG